MTIPNIELIEGDMLEQASRLTDKYDVIVARYTVHHLNTADKGSIFTTLRKHLSPQGLSIVYDTIRNEGEPNQKYLDRALKHVPQNDIPKPWSTWTNSAQNSGYAAQEFLYREPNEIFDIVKFS